MSLRKIVSMTVRVLTAALLSLLVCANPASATASGISGVVSGEQGPLQGVWVDVFDSVTWDWLGGTYTGEGGTYVVSDLPAGSYVVSFDPFEYNEQSAVDYQWELYQDAKDWDAADTVVVTEGAVTSGIDAVLEVLLPQGISGTVTLDGLPAEGVCVEAHDLISWNPPDSLVGCAYTDTDGSYLMSDLPPGRYLVYFNLDDYNAENGSLLWSEWYPNTRTYAPTDAQVITVMEATVVAGIDAQLERQPASSISGFVTGLRPGSESEYLEGVRVTLDGPDGSPIATTYTGIEGFYSFADVPPGNHAIHFDAEERNVAYGTWYIGDDRLCSVDMGTNGRCDCWLYPGGVLSGRVTGRGEPLGGIRVTARSLDVEPESVHETYTRADGSYVLILASGRYTLEFDATGYNLEHGTTVTSFKYWSRHLGGTWPFTPVSVSWDGSRRVDVALAGLPVSSRSIEGPDRISTAIAVSRQAFPDGADFVLIATASNWPDALGGSALAGVLKAPILLTGSTGLRADVLAEIERLGARHAYVLGSTRVVSKAVEDTLDARLAGTVDRLSGDDRYQTARAIAQETVRLQGSPAGMEGFLATGDNFPDALMIAPLAAVSGTPIYLVDPRRGLDAALWSALRADHVVYTIIVGSDQVVSTEVELELLRTLGWTNVQRWYGGDRYGTAVAVARSAPAYGLDWSNLAIATGSDFPDALTGGVLQGLDGSLLLITPGKSMSPFIKLELFDNRAAVNQVRFLGSPQAVSNDVRAAVKGVLEQ